MVLQLQGTVREAVSLVEYPPRRAVQGQRMTPSSLTLVLLLFAGNSCLAEAAETGFGAFIEDPLIPLVIIGGSFLVAILIAARIYKKYKKEFDEARKKGQGQTAASPVRQQQVKASPKRPKGKTGDSTMTSIAIDDESNHANQTQRSPTEASAVGYTHSPRHLQGVERRDSSPTNNGSHAISNTRDSNRATEEDKRSRQVRSNIRIAPRRGTNRGRKFMAGGSVQPDDDISSGEQKDSRDRGR
eukprot:gb/GECG01002794.1/.p1 GENE.gb/GECG01002794.1/~~gb/GECG01002794.1/.p1  ORF type:complete len:243 (+),score=34.11 gb/GECG01002794.1/:1-729(+)